MKKQGSSRNRAINWILAFLILIAAVVLVLLIAEPMIGQSTEAQQVMNPLHLMLRETAYSMNMS